MSDVGYLEYGEESDGDDLFGSDNEDVPAAFRDTRAPIVPSDAARSGSSKQKQPEPTPPNYAPISRTDKGETEQRVTPDQRLVQLRRQRATLSPPPEFGVPSLKTLCAQTVRFNAARIYDIGGLEYSILDEFLCNCAREQLAEIETNSPHIMKDTDWLWEYFVIDEYPLFYESCRLRKGQPRVNGWRRMYEKGAKDAEERRLLAMERVANRYKQLEQERASKRIVVMDTLVAPKANKWGRSTGAHALSSARRGASAAAGYSAQSKMQGALNKARSDSQRARVALTHASGKFVPPSSSAFAARRQPAADTSQLYSNPYTATSSSSSSAGVKYLGPRLPAPRTSRPKAALPDAYPTLEGPPPARSRPAPPSSTSYGPPAPQAVRAEERFRIGDAKRELRPIHKPKVENFPSRKPVVDFFGTTSAMSTAPPSPMKRSASSANGGDPKRARPGPSSSSRSQSPERVVKGEEKRPQPSTLPPTRPQPPARPPPPPKTAKELESVLFLKKKRPAPRR